MNCSDVIRERRSIRKFKKGAPIPQEHVHKILEAAMMAPSACNSRPWEFVVVESSKVKQQILEAHPYTQMLATASLAIIVCGRPDLQEGLSKGYWPQDCAAATSTMLLQAAELGYGTCWCGCYPYKIVHLLLFGVQALYALFLSIFQHCVCVIILVPQLFCQCKRIPILGIPARIPSLV